MPSSHGLPYPKESFRKRKNELRDARAKARNILTAMYPNPYTSEIYRSWRACDFVYSRVLGVVTVWRGEAATPLVNVARHLWGASRYSSSSGRGSRSVVENIPKFKA